MKIKTDFVTNSSSTSFLIKLKPEANQELTLRDFILEVGKRKLNAFLKRYDWYQDRTKFNWEQMKLEAERYIDETFVGGSTVEEFGDDSGTVVGTVFDYMLRSGGKSKNFEWEFYESNR